MSIDSNNNTVMEAAMAQPITIPTGPGGGAWPAYDPKVCAIHLHDTTVYLGLISFPTPSPGWVMVGPWTPAIPQHALLIPATTVHRIEAPAPAYLIQAAFQARTAQVRSV